MSGKAGQLDWQPRPGDFVLLSHPHLWETGFTLKPHQAFLHGLTARISEVSGHEFSAFEDPHVAVEVGGQTFRLFTCDLMPATGGEQAWGESGEALRAHLEAHQVRQQQATEQAERAELLRLLGKYGLPEEWPVPPAQHRRKTHDTTV